jgi:hemoglobin-like flavoprotein
MIVPLLPQKGLQLLRKDLDKLLQSYRDEFDSCLSGREQQTRESMAALAVLAELMSDREPAYRPRFRGISKKLLRLAATPDMETIHQTLLAEIRQLSRYADEAEGANQLAVGRVNV